MTKKLNPILKQENRAILLQNGMENIDRLQQKIIKEAREKIKDYNTFQRTVFQQLQTEIVVFKEKQDIV